MNAANRAAFSVIGIIPSITRSGTIVSDCALFHVASR